MKFCLHISWILLILLIVSSHGYLFEGPIDGPSCSFGMDAKMYNVLGAGIVSISQKRSTGKSRIDGNTVVCAASYPLDFEMTGVPTQLMAENLRSQQTMFKTLFNKTFISTTYSISISLTNLWSPRRFTFYKLGNRTMSTTFFLITHGAVAFPDKGPAVNVESNREILTLPCIVSDKYGNSTSLSLKKLVNETKKEQVDETRAQDGMITRETRFQTITVVEDVYPVDGMFLTYNTTKGLLLNSTYFKNPHGDFNCIYTSPVNRTEERFPNKISPPKDSVFEPDQAEVIVFQNGKLHLSCRSTQEFIMSGNFNKAVVNIPSTKPSYKTHLRYEAEYILENTTVGDFGMISCSLKSDQTKIMHTWRVHSLDMWNNSKLSLAVGNSSVICKSEFANLELSYIVCSSESNCRHRLPCFHPGVSCQSSERVKYGTKCSSKANCMEISTEEQFSQGVIGCKAGNISAWSYVVKGFDGKIYSDWHSAPASALIEVTAPKEKLYAGGRFDFVCQFSTFVSDGEVKWYYRKKNDTSPTLYGLYALVTNGQSSPVKSKLTLLFKMSHIVCSIPQWDGKALWNVSLRINIERTEAPTVKNLGHSRNPIFVNGQTGRSISCAAHGLPQPKIEWLKDGVSVAGDFQQIETYNEDNAVELRFPPIKKEHSGVYVCKAKNVVNFVEQNFSVEVRDAKKPHFDNETMHHVFYVGDTVEIECKVESFPRPTITWTYLNSTQTGTYKEYDLETSSSIRLSSISKKGAGEYISTCTATNVFGTAEQYHAVKLEERSSPVLAIVIGASIAIAALFIPLVLVFWRLQVAKKEIRDLTAAEVEEFFNGNPNEKKRVENDYTDLDALGVQSCLFSSLPYNKNFEITKDSLAIDESARLGEGAFGMVLKAKIKGMDEFVAVKTVKPNSEVSYFKALLSELKIMIYIGKNQNVVNLIGAYTENIKKRELYIVVELCHGGSLEKHLKGISQKQNFQDEIYNDDVAFEIADDEENDPDILMQKRFEEGHLTSTSDLIRWSYQIANGMEYLANKKVIHSDLSTRNVLLHEDGTIRITDFGLSRQLYDYTNYVKKNQAPLPWRWMAIESLRNMTFSTQSDVWAFGVTMWEIFSLADIPYPGKSWTVDFVDELTHGLRMKKPRFATHQIYRIMYDCWMDQPEDRPSFDELKISIFKVAYGNKENPFGDTLLIPSSIPSGYISGKETF